jgi:hypothetical protein
MADRFKNLLVHTQILRSTTARQHQPIVRAHIHLIERRIHNEVMSALFAVRLIPFKIVNRRADVFAGFLLRANWVKNIA